jgi:hypothetical protein
VRRLLLGWWLLSSSQEDPVSVTHLDLYHRFRRF